MFQSEWSSDDEQHKSPTANMLKKPILISFRTLKDIGNGLVVKKPCVYLLFRCKCGYYQIMDSNEECKCCAEYPKMVNKNMPNKFLHVLSSMFDTEAHEGLEDKLNLNQHTT